VSPQASDAFNFDYGRSLIFEPHNIFREILILLDWVCIFLALYEMLAQQNLYGGTRPQKSKRGQIRFLKFRNRFRKHFSLHPLKKHMCDREAFVQVEHIFRS